MARISKYITNNKAMSSTKQWRAGLYLRLSKEDGDKDDENKFESDSIYSQRLIIEDFLSENLDIQLESEYPDDGYTGTNFDRPEFQRMIEDIRVGRINCVIVKDLSRFGRNYLEAGQYLDIFFPVMNIRFISVVDNIDSYLFPSSMNNISVSFKNVMNEEYCRDISNKIRSTFVAKRENGEYICGFALYGYIRDTENKGQLLVDPEAGEVVRQIFQWFTEGLSYRMITFKLNEMGIPNPAKYKSMKYRNYNRNSNNSGFWSVQTVRNILKNRMYTGDLVQGKYEKINHKVKKIRATSEDKWVIVENHHEGLVDKTLFFNIQPIINRDMKISQKTKELPMFSGFLKCADCGRQMVKKNASREKFRDKYHYYTCATYDMMTKTACTRHTMRSDILEQTVFKIISNYIQIAVNMDELINAINRSPIKTAATSKIQTLISVKEKERNKIERILLDLYPDLKNELISKSQYLLLKERYENEIKQIDQVIIGLKTSLEQDKNGVDGSNDFIRNFKKFKDSEKLTREILIAIVDEIYIYEGGGIEINFKFQDAFNKAIDYIQVNCNLLNEINLNILQQIRKQLNLEVAV